MGLASALSTALTGLTASETSIDVVGNNLANSSTVGFKASQVTFATQFLQTYGFGSAPTATSGGTNTLQIGLGTQVSSVQANFTQGTISNTSATSDLAIQGNGFFIIQASDGSYAYTRDGEFTLNSKNQLVTANGNFVLGYTVDENFDLQTSSLDAITIPLGTKMVAEATKNAALDGTLTPSGDVADQAEVLNTETLGDDTKTYPGATTAAATDAAITTGITTADGGATTGSVQAGNYLYKVVYSKVDGSDVYSEGVQSSSTVAASVAANNSSIILSNLSTVKTAANTAGFQYVNLYRATVGGGGSVGTFSYIDSIKTSDITAGYTYTDTASAGSSDLNTDTISGTYGYYIAYYNSTTQKTSDPVAITESGSKSITATDDRINITLPPSETTSGDWDSWVIYRNTDTDKTTYHEVNSVKFSTGATSYIDSSSNSTISANPTMNTIGTGALITDTTLLTDVIKYNSSTSTYDNLFTTGTLTVSEKKGNEKLDNSFTITSTSTVGDLMRFFNQSLGIQTGSGIPNSKNAADPSTPYTPGAQIIDGKITVVGNNGVDNDVTISSLALTPDSGTKEAVDLPFSQVQAGVGQSASTSFTVYDSLGIACPVTVTAVLQSTSSTATTYRWFADSTSNLTTGSAQVAIGTGLITFDGNGNVVSVVPNTISINRDGIASSKPLVITLNFDNVSGLAVTTGSSLSPASNGVDGFGPGTLTSYTISGDGVITGVFDNSAKRELAQIRLANFTNPNGLVQLGQNLYAAGVNSGSPQYGNPGEKGIGTIQSGSVELSNADVGSSLIDLILASTMYRSNTKVISTVQTMLETLLQLQR
jgi:flagellar hook protein FlgE